MHIAIVVTQSLLRGRILERLAIGQGGIARRGFLEHLVAQSPQLHELLGLLSGYLVSIAQQFIGAIGTARRALQPLETLYIVEERRALCLGHLKRGIIGALLQRVALLNRSRIIVPTVT